MAALDRMDERLRTLGLVEGRRMAQALFAEVAARGLIPSWTIQGAWIRSCSSQRGVRGRLTARWDAVRYGSAQAGALDRARGR
ncbi:hypothetical protein ACFCWG_01475 [Streptomyces sp. NPDC056390]|uniref:hypothetical protein n=1 Tax=Streptomyces sp. NPDC056390 TaxID=3345806 RepID=UPI0035E0D4DF